MVCIFASTATSTTVWTSLGTDLGRRIFPRTTPKKCRCPSMKRKLLRRITATQGSNPERSHSKSQPTNFAIHNVDDEREFEPYRFQENPHPVNRRFVLGLISVVLCAQENYGHVAVARAAVTKRVRLKDVENPKLQDALRAAVAGDLEESERLFTELIEEDPENASVWSNRGSVRLSMDKFDEATADLSQAIKLAPEAAVPFFNRAIAYELNRPEEARKLVEGLVRKYPNYAEAHAALAAILWSEDRRSSAEDQFSEATVREPLYREIGWVNIALQWPPSIVQAMENFLSIKE